MALTNLLDASRKADAIYRTGSDKNIADFMREISPDAFAHHEEIVKSLRDGRSVGASGQLAGDLAHIEGHGSLSGNGGSSAFDFAGGESIVSKQSGKLPSGVKTSAKSAHRTFEQMAKDARKVGEKLHKDIGKANEDLANHYKKLVEDLEDIGAKTTGASANIKGKNGILTGSYTATGGITNMNVVVGGETINLAETGGLEKAKDAAKKWLDGRTELLEEYRGLVADKYGDFKEFILEARGKIKDTTGILNKYGKTEGATESTVARTADETALKATEHTAPAAGGNGLRTGLAVGGGAVLGYMLGNAIDDEEGFTMKKGATTVGGGLIGYLVSTFMGSTSSNKAAMKTFPEVFERGAGAISHHMPL